MVIGHRASQVDANRKGAWAFELSRVESSRAESRWVGQQEGQLRLGCTKVIEALLACLLDAMIVTLAVAGWCVGLPCR